MVSQAIGTLIVHASKICLKRVMRRVASSRLCFALMPFASAVSFCYIVAVRASPT